MAYKKTGQFEAIRKNLQKVVSRYGYSNFTFTVPDSGIENSTLIIKSDITFVLRVYRYGKKSDADIMREIDFMQTLRNNNILVPLILPNTSNEYVTKITIDDIQWRAIAMEYIHGQHPESYTRKIVDQLAANQAPMHKVGVQYARQVGAKSHLNLKPGEFLDQIDDDVLKSGGIRSFIGRARDYSVSLDESLPSGYVHIDYDIDNTLFDDKDNLMGTLDFDDLVVMPTVVCLAFSLWSVLFKSDDRGLVKQYIDTYTQTTQLAALERLDIPRILLFRHYAISSLFVLEGKMDNALFQKCEKIESELLDMIKNKQPVNLPKA